MPGSVAISRLLQVSNNFAGPAEQLLSGTVVLGLGLGSMALSLVELTVY